MPDRVRKALFVPCVRRYNLVWSSPLVSFFGDGIYDVCVLKYYGFPLVKSVLRLF